jgi:opacity protein-like surface antigen
VNQTAASDALWGQPDPSPIPVIEPGTATDYTDAMKGGYEGTCNTIAGPCGGSCGCHNHYLYANALLFNRLRPGGFATSVYGNGDQAINFCNREFGGQWVGGFEIGGGWCFGCGCNQALEVVYWGLYPGFGDNIATGTLDSMIDFSNVDYDGGSADLFFDGAAAHRIRYDLSFHSFEANLIGNCGGPLGCGRCGCCSPCHGSRWGHSWLAGFRYINFSSDFLFSADNADTVFDGSDSELNYEVDLDNDLYGFQLGVGLDYCVTSKLQAYAVAKFGVYLNDISHRQAIYGPLGAGTLNTGDFAGQDYVIDDSDVDLAFAGQMDLGARYAFHDNWSVDFGWRLLGLSGVAITEDNVAQGNFQNVLGISDTQTTGSLILHGGYVGLTYCW